MGFTPQLEKQKIDSNLLFSVLGKVITVEVDERYFVSGKLIRFERVGEARHKPFVLVLLLSDGRTVITKWEGIIYW